MLQEAKRQQEHDFKWNVGENSDWLTEQNPNPRKRLFLLSWNKMPASLFVCEFKRES